MKKIKLSRLMILAIVFAVGSAFTINNHGSTTHSKVNFLWYPNDAHNTGNPLTATQVDGAISYTDADLTPSFLSMHCPTASIICLAKFQEGPIGPQQAFKLGRYQ